MKQVLQFITWPAIAGILAALILLQWYDGSVLSDRGNSTTNGSPARVSFAPAVQRAIPSVVNIYTTTIIRDRRHQLDGRLYRRYLNNGGEQRAERLQRSLGSGVIVSAEGLVLTSRHIIAEADEILVLLHDGRTALAQVVGSDIDTDLAVLQIELADIQAISFGNPDQAQVGDVVLAIGNPYGFGHSVSQGIISAMGRYGLKLSTYEDFIQTDAAINEGNSGGALIDTEGRLLGINAATFSASTAFSGIGLATPADLAMGVTQDLVTFGKVIRGWMGLEVANIYRSGSAVPSLLVRAVHPDGPAARNGLRPDDVITHIDMQPVSDGQFTMNQIALMRPGDAVELSVWRGTEELNINVIVGSRPEREDAPTR